MKKVLSLTILITLMAFPLFTANAQETIEQQFMDAARDLEPDAKLEFLELIRDPGEMAGVFESIGIQPELADRIEDRLGAWDEGYFENQAFDKLEKIDDKIERKLANIENGQIGKAEKTLEKALRKTDKVLDKVEKKEVKVEEKADKADQKDKDKDKDKDKVTPDPDPQPDPVPDPDPGNGGGKDKKK